MRRIAATVALLATLVAPIHAAASAGMPGCDGVRASDCCCPMPQGDEADERTGPAVEGVCCCDVEPAAATSSSSPMSPPPASPAVVAAGAAEIADVQAACGAGEPLAYAPARGPPPTGTLFSQAIALLL